jgi:ferredoxin-NADP reductase
MNNTNNQEYIVQRNLEEATGIRTITFRPKGDIPIYRPGQFITVYYPGASTVEGKSYSLTSIPGDEVLSITVKAMGEFSNMLCGLAVGDCFSGSNPYGYFYSEETDTDLVMIGAGIGSVPFRGMIKEELTQRPGRHLHLIRSNTTIDHIVFQKELHELARTYPNFCITDFITRQDMVPGGYRKGRMNTAAILEAISGLRSPEFLLCGPISFTRDIWTGLRHAGVPEERLYTEAFFS